MTKDEALDLALEALEANQPVNYCVNSKGEKFPMLTKDPFKFERNAKAITAIKQARALDKKADNAMIYKTFEQWMNGDFLEVGEPRKKAYSKDELLLVEMGWNYGYDAGRAVEQALDKKADNARELGLDYEPVQEPDRTGMTYYKNDKCKAASAHAPDCICWTPAAQPAPDLQAELEATNRQVEILSDALAESRREVAQLKAQPAPVQEPVAWNKKIRDSVDSLLAQAGFDSDSSVRHQLAMMNFDANPASMLPEKWRNVLPGGRGTDQWESARVADFNKGWNEYRKAAKAALEKLEVTPPAAPVQEPVAWMDASGDIYKHELWPDWNPPHTPLYTTPPAAPTAQEPVLKPLSKKWKWVLHKSFADVAGFDEEGIPSFYWKESVTKFKSGELSVPCKGKNCGSLNGWLHSAECRAEHEAQYTTPPAAPVHEPEIVQRVKRYAGQTLRTARNPNITARECIELANWLAANTTPPAAQRQWVYLTELEKSELWNRDTTIPFSYADAIEAKLKEKNT